ncbi:zinc finger, CCHC-type containing protein [Tanacetum coccineum]
MDQNNLNDFDSTDTYDHYDAFFQPDYDRYMRDYESYQHYVGLCEQEAGGSSDGPKRRRTYIFREREEAEQRLIDDYFGDDEYEPKYPEEKFRRRKTWTPRNAREYRLYALDWKNCPKALHGQFKRSTHKYPTLMLEAVADQKLWIWHAYFGVPGANNDLNVLYGSPLFDDEIADIAPECPFVVNGHTYRKGYYLADGIYPAWSTFVKTFSVARDEKSLKFKRVQEAARKDIERAFRVLQGRWGIIRQPARAMQINTLKRIMYCCIILHNMILEDEGFEVNFRDMFVNPAPNIVRDLVERCDLHVRKTKELRDRKTHIDLRQDLMEHLWNNDDE